jgi:MFS family permease
LAVIQLVLVLFGLYFGTINVSLPIINDTFNSSISLTSWIVIAYSVALVVGIPIAGRLPGIFSVKQIFIG